ncbi:NAD(P)/FAD-dependent oxidoreductase [Pseudohalocynthiibacter sp. F2068]|jgi:protoporphyrinogen oxidase|uniref:NAD(P)/FAD-dependent oxidoreductase n=1 Tax=Pseudohalocynthiibacter sp. F2068 TaxID=2926418 RepID=UPI001FF39225|nr:NAD(P)/FAD-dependent oxidoreductase [Pseudohalocynthiibacter sp. F2068]MCK0104294.1 NAD(P)/FAD-dependent oxidoreductase [Pseudohalocynthiibacter sp. F2068]
MNSNEQKLAVVIGAGPAGLTGAYELQRLGDEFKPVVLEASNLVGGIARTESHNGFRFDIGGHRFFTKIKEVEQVWYDICGDEFITVPRQSRIYYQGKFYDYPLKIFNALSNLGIYESVRVMASFARWKLFPNKEEKTFEQWVTNRFGARLFHHFFRSYTEKVWGVPCAEITADWAAQRIKDLSLMKVVWNAISGANDSSSLIEEFQYPRLGPGQMWEKMTDRVQENGGEVRMHSYVKRVIREKMRVTGVEVEEKNPETGETRSYIQEGDTFLNSMNLRKLVRSMDPPPPQHVIDAANLLKYRDFMIITLVLDHADPFPDNWIYVHGQEVRVGRIQNFRAWSQDMMADKSKASIGMEYFLNDDEEMWAMDDDVLIKMAAKELETIGLAPAKSVIDGAIIRQPKAYPVYDSVYMEALDTVRDWLQKLENFETAGRNGLHRYNNQDHSMLSAMYAARNIMGADYDIWDVNVERSYHEEFQTKPYERRGAASVA